MQLREQISIIYPPCNWKLILYYFVNTFFFDLGVEVYACVYIPGHSVKSNFYHGLQ